jgi:hypothetical protein
VLAGGVDAEWCVYEMNEVEKERRVVVGGKRLASTSLLSHSRTSLIHSLTMRCRDYRPARQDHRSHRRDLSRFHHHLGTRGLLLEVDCRRANLELEARLTYRKPNTTGSVHLTLARLAHLISWHAPTDRSCNPALWDSIYPANPNVGLV